MKYFFWILVLFLLFSNCKNEESRPEAMPVEPDNGIGDGAPSLEDAFIQTINTAHNKQEFLAHDAIAFDIDLNFGGQDRMDGTITMLTDSGKMRVDNKKGSTLFFDGEKVYMSPQDADEQGARFDIFTWPYFFAFPYKLADEGAKLQPLGNIMLNDIQREAFKLSFEPGTGDAPDDWYVGYLNKDQTIHAAGYIVTYGRTKEKAEESPHAILYGNYQEIDGIPIATTWKFYNWTQEEGLKGEPIGDATLSNIKFLVTDENFFKAPAGAKIIE